MDLYFKIKSGPRSGDLFKIQDAMTLGRSRATVNLKDPKVSSFHGKVELASGKFYYVDSDSTNGSFCEGKKIKKILLERGCHIVLGNTEIEVVNELDLKKASSRLSPWRESLYNLLQTITPLTLEAPLDIFEKCLCVRVTRGPFVGRQWILGYGPRFIGPGSPDLCLPSHDLPSLCLKIYKSDKEIKIESTNQKKYVFDGVEKWSDSVQDGLTVDIGEHSIQFHVL